MEKDFLKIIRFLEASRPAVSPRSEDSKHPAVSDDLLRRFVRGELKEEEIREIAPTLLQNKSARKRLCAFLKEEDTHGTG